MSTGLRPGNLHKELQDLTRCGDLSALRHHLEEIIPSLSIIDQNELCAHNTNPCGSNTPCLKKISYLAEDAVISSQLGIFEYLWDRWLGPGHVLLSWGSLIWAAAEGAIDFAESFWAREPSCFSRLSPETVRGPPEGESQITHALKFNKYDYADYILAHGVDINGGSEYWKIVPTIVGCRASSGIACEAYIV